MAVSTFACPPCCGGTPPGPFPCCNPPGVPLVLTGTFHVAGPPCGLELDGLSSVAIYNAFGDGAWHFGVRAPQPDPPCVAPESPSFVFVSLCPCDSDDPLRFKAVCIEGNGFRCCPASPPAASVCCNASVGFDGNIFPDSASCDPFVLAFTLTSSGFPIFTLTVTG